MSIKITKNNENDIVIAVSNFLSAHNFEIVKSSTFNQTGDDIHARIPILDGILKSIKIECKGDVPNRNPDGIIDDWDSLAMATFGALIDIHCKYKNDIHGIALPILDFGQFNDETTLDKKDRYAWNLQRLSSFYKNNEISIFLVDANKQVKVVPALNFEKICQSNFDSDSILKI